MGAATKTGQTGVLRAAPPASACVPDGPGRRPRLRPPVFKPHPLLAGGHLQTLAAYVARPRIQPPPARPHVITLPDGDRLVLHEDAPPSAPVRRLALLVHGLGGCHASPYLLRLAVRLREAGVATVRLDLRGCGAGVGLARWPNHAGRSDDLAAVVAWLARRWPKLPVTLIGFSLAGNMALKLAGEVGASPPGRLDSVISICAPIDLSACVRRLRYGLNRFYDRYITRVLVRRLNANRRRNPRLVLPERLPRPRTLEAFDALYTAPVCGFADRSDYYARSSAARVVESISISGLVMAARDDPLISFRPYRRLRWPSCVDVWTTSHGGHMGYIAARGADADVWWLDWRVVEWVGALDRAAAEAPALRHA